LPRLPLIGSRTERERLALLALKELHLTQGLFRFRSRFVRSAKALSLAFVLTIGPVERFQKSRKLVSYLELNPSENSTFVPTGNGRK
jgi:hypothetical protein